MSSDASPAGRWAEKLAGRVKTAVGAWRGDRQLEGEGRLQEHKANAEDAADQQAVRAGIEQEAADATAEERTINAERSRMQAEDDARAAEDTVEAERRQAETVVAAQSDVQHAEAARRAQAEEQRAEVAKAAAEHGYQEANAEAGRLEQEAIRARRQAETRTHEDQHEKG